MTVSPSELGNSGLPGAEPAVADYHIWMPLAEPAET